MTVHAKGGTLNEELASIHLKDFSNPNSRLAKLQITQLRTLFKVT